MFQNIFNESWLFFEYCEIIYVVFIKTVLIDAVYKLS